LSILSKLLTHVGLNIIQVGNFVTVRDEDVTIYLVDQYLIHDIWLDLASLLDYFIQCLASHLKIWVMSINNVDKSTT